VGVGSPQTLSEADRRIVVMWAADCAEGALAYFSYSHLHGEVRSAI
jgi:hypothetical protein